MKSLLGKAKQLGLLGFFWALVLALAGDLIRNHAVASLESDDERI
jgi:hypothetical protein